MNNLFGKKRYNSFSNMLKKEFGEKVHKISVHCSFTCPNRDGKVGYGGCIYCNNQSLIPKSFVLDTEIKHQILNSIDYVKNRYNAKKFIVYFQTYTNTYAPTELLRKLFYSALEIDNVVGLSIGTRPDCVPVDILELLAEISERHYLWVEYGLQSSRDETLKLINRGHTVSDFIDAVKRTKERGIKICAHVILGLPGESISVIIETAKLCSALNIDGIKIHNLHVLKNTPLEEMYRNGDVKILEREEYISLLVDFLEHLSPKITVHRLVSDASRDLLVAPNWMLNKLEILNAIEKELEIRNSYQGIIYERDKANYSQMLFRT